MPHTAPNPFAPPTMPAITRRRAVWVALLLVAAAHWLVLSGAPLWVPVWGGDPVADNLAVRPLQTRTLPAPSPPQNHSVPAAPKPSARNPALTPQRAEMRQPQAPAMTDRMEAAPDRPPPPAATISETTQVDPPIVTSTTTSTTTSQEVSSAHPSGAASAPVAAPAPLTGASAPTTVPPAQTRQSAAVIKVPEPVRLIYEGRGQERGFINYYGTAELVWKPGGTQYEASMEISTLGIRMVTWTSKGALSAEGLLPRRFGDRRRGPETATHFQRDKGIISFSANNPDVPLLPGAQDKLSVLLQLSSLQNGDPARFAEGGHVEIQAADAHRAEIWNFSIKPAENLVLPGGTVKAIAFIKEPDLQYDQKIEAWFAPELNYLPVRLRITESNGSFSDLLWKRSTKPE